MPGPFPGMDPYLEDPDYWRGFHNHLITFATAALNASLPPGIIAKSDERLYVLPSERSIYPDVTVSKLSSVSSPQGRTGGTTVLEGADPSGMLTIYPVTVHEGFIEIRTVSKPKRILTVIEILSPSNKAMGSVGRNEYLQKQQDVLNSETNLLEIDLLRRGAHTVAASYEDLRTRGTWEYLVCLHRCRQRYTYEYWMNTVRQRLPRVWIPLTESLPEAVLDLQEVFDAAYDAGAFRQEVEYQQEPPTPLTPEDTVWADALLREKGLRT